MLIINTRAPNFRSHLAMFGSSLIFGTNYWIAKGLMPVYLTPEQIIFWRILVTVILFWVASLFITDQKVSRKDLWIIAGCTLLGVVLNQYLFFLGLRLSNPVEVAILHTTSPIIVLVFAAFIIHERVTGKRIAGMILGAVGALSIVINGKHLSFSLDTMQGNIYILMNITTYSLYLVLIKPVMRRYNPITVMKWAFLFGLIMVTPFTIQPAMQVQFNSFPPNIWFSFLYVILGSTFLAYLLVTFSLQKLSAAVVGFYIYLQPLIAAVHGIIIYHEPLSMIKVIAAILIFTGVYLVNKK
ncbi:MAG: DMT family transporter [Bacteroidales bacterium]